MQPKEFADAVMEMHHEIAFLEFGEINVERRTGGLRVGGLEPARLLALITAEDFRVGDDNHLGFVTDEATRERAELGGGTGGMRDAGCGMCAVGF